jgi:hypothetical protein
MNEPYKRRSAPAAFLEKTGRESKENIGDFGRRVWLIGHLLDEKAATD